MADDVMTSTKELEAATVNRVEIRRFINDALKIVAPEIDPLNIENIIPINTLASGIIEYSNRPPDNPAAAMQALEANIINTLKNGPADDLMPRVTEMYNLVIQGVSDGKFRTALSQSKENKTALKKQREQSARSFTNTLNNIAATNALIDAASEAAAEAAGISAATYRNLSKHIDNNISETGRLTAVKIASDIAAGGDINKNDADTLLEEQQEAVDDDPAYKNMSVEQKIAFHKIKMTEEFTKNLAGEPHNLSPEEALSLAEKKVENLLEESPDLFLNKIMAEETNISANKYNQEEGAKLAALGLTQGATSEDFTDPSKINASIAELLGAPTADKINNFATDMEESIAENGNKGIAIRDAQEGLEANIQNLKNSPLANDPVIRNEIAQYELQISELDQTFDELTNMNMLLIETKTFVEDNAETIINATDPAEIMRMALENEDLKTAIDAVSGGIGSDKWRNSIEAVAESIGLKPEFIEGYITSQIQLNDAFNELNTIRGDLTNPENSVLIAGEIRGTGATNNSLIFRNEEGNFTAIDARNGTTFEITDFYIIAAIEKREAEGQRIGTPEEAETLRNAHQNFSFMELEASIEEHSIKNTEQNEPKIYTAPLPASQEEIQATFEEKRPQIEAYLNKVENPEVMLQLALVDSMGVPPNQLDGITQLIQETFWSESDAPKPLAPNDEIQFITDNKEALIRTVEDYPNSTIEDLKASITEMGLTPQEAEKIVAEMAKMHEFKDLAPDLFKTSQPPAPEVMTPEEVELAASAVTANNDAAPLKIGA